MLKWVAGKPPATFPVGYPFFKKEILNGGDHTLAEHLIKNALRE
ncbi:hypothetical protein [Paenisporosarcina antarctica]|nr:hypothetical protein [Paenisporosarcina antarctica]